MKTSSQSQERILKLLELSDRAISAQNIWAELQKQGQSIGIATVYRNLELLRLRGLVQTRILHHEALYAVISGDRYFATCLHCGESVSIETPISEGFRPTLQSQFEVFYHTLEVFGLCSPCKSGPRSQ